MRILFVEDNQEVRDMIKTIFKNHSVSCVDTEKEVLWFIRDRVYDVIILDWTLEIDEGIRIGRTIRKICTTPTLMLTDISDVSSIVKALDSGFDDYMVKPFSSKELLARTKKLSTRRRKTAFRETKLFLGDLCIDIKRHMVRKDNDEIKLTKSEFQILKCLAMKRGDLIRRERLMLSFSGDCKSNHLLNTHIANLRKKVVGFLEIITVPGKGYLIR